MVLTLNESSTGLKKTLLLCFGASVLIHIVLLALLCLPLVVSLFKPEMVVMAKKLEKKRARSIVVALVRPKAKAKPKPISPERKREPAAKKKPQPQQQKKPLGDIAAKSKSAKNQYERTSDQQLTGKVPETNLEGERDTIAASNAVPRVGAPDRAAVKGGQTPFDEVVDTSYQDGAFEHMNKGSKIKPTKEEGLSKTEPTEDAATIAQKEQNEQKEAKSSVVPSKELGQALDQGKLANQSQENERQKKFLDAEKKRYNPVSEEKEKKLLKEQLSNDKGREKLKKTIANRQPEPDAPKQKPQQEKRKKKVAHKDSPKHKSPKRSSKGFRSQAKAQVMVGSISRHSKIASRNVKATPLGKYMAEVSKRVEQEWQRRCLMHADLIQPGTVRISFLLTSNGKVLQLRTLYKEYGSENQLSLTHQAIRSVRLPPMPASVRKSQNGDPIEFRYTFDF